MNLNFVVLIQEKIDLKSDGEYVIIFDGYNLIGPYGIVLYMNRDNVTNFDTFRVDIFQIYFRYIPQEMKNSYEIKTP